VKLHTQLFVSLAAGAAAGVLARLLSLGWLLGFLVALEPVGIAFIRLITMVVIPLVVASLFVGTASLGDLRRLGRIGGKTLAYFLATTLVAATIGLALALMVRPGAGMNPAVREAMARQFEGAAQGAAATAQTAPSLVERLVAMVPRNPVEAAAEMDLLPLIVFTIIFGAAASLVAEERRRVIVTFFEGVNELCMVVIAWVMKLAPYAVFALIAAVVSRFGIELLQRLVVYSAVVAVGLLLHTAGTFGLALRFLARVRIGTFIKHVGEAPLLAFSTSSSNATLPVSMEVTEKNLGVSNEVASFVLPLGATINMNGSALYKGATAVFVAQVYGLTLGGADLLTIILTSTLAAVAGVGVPSSSLVTTLIVLNAIGLGPQAAAGIALVLGVERPLDMLRTAVNVTGDLTGAAVIARSEGEELAGSLPSRQP
jgi:Na+/H+-dicarboxylate symporter